MIKFILVSDSGQLRVLNLCSRQISIWAYQGIMQIFISVTLQKDQKDAFWKSEDLKMLYQSLQESLFALHSQKQFTHCRTESWYLQ